MILRCACVGRGRIASSSALLLRPASKLVERQQKSIQSFSTSVTSSSATYEHLPKDKFDFSNQDNASSIDGPRSSRPTRRQSWFPSKKESSSSERLTKVLRNASNGIRTEKRKRSRRIGRQRRKERNATAATAVAAEEKGAEEANENGRKSAAKEELMNTLRESDNGQGSRDDRKLGNASGLESSVIRRLQDQRKTWSWNTPMDEKAKSQEKAAKYLFSDIEIPTERSKKSDTNNVASAKQERSATSLHTGKEAEERRTVQSKEQHGTSTNDDEFVTRYSPVEDTLSVDERWSTTVGGMLAAADVEIKEIAPLREMEVPELAHGLDRVLFNPGVYWLRDPRSGIYNFDPQIRNLYDVDLFDYSALPPYQTSSMDDELAALTRKHGKRYSGSTSSLTGLLSHIYFFISAWKSPNLTGFTEGFNKMPKGFAFGAKLPANIYLRRFEERSEEDPERTSVRYAIDNDKSAAGEADNSNYVLTQLGKSVEKLLTSSPEEYERYLRINSHQISEEERNKKEAYYYSASDKFMMRSQLDCSDDRLPRRTFDLKTRAVVAVRMDRANWVESSGYTLRTNTGVNESFERELWDMSRGTLLKYFFQARIGNMDGIMVAYHSTSSMFGFQYLPREDLAKRLFGSEQMGEQAYRLAIGMLERILDQVTGLFSDKTLRITVDAQASELRRNPSLNVFVRGEKDGEALAKHQDETREAFLFRADVDRYLSEALVEGPVDFNQPEGRQVDASKEDEILRRQRKNLPPLSWNVEWSLKPCSDMNDAETNRNLKKVLQRQKNVSAMQMPNIEALNERERSRQEALRVNPEAWQKFLEDRKSGRAAGMPIAPGQLPLEQDGFDADLNWQDVGEAEGGDGKTTMRMLRTADEQTDKQTTEEDVLQSEVQMPQNVSVTAEESQEATRALPPHLNKNNKVKWVQSTVQINRLRQLAQLGQKDKDEREKTDRLQIYERRGD